MDYFEDDLFDSLTKGNLKSLKEYLDKGLDVNHAFRSNDRPDRLGQTLIEVALKSDQKKVAKLLVDRKCNANLKYIVNVVNYTYILQRYAKKDGLKLTCMYPAIVKGDVETIKLLVLGGFDVNIHDDRGCTALWHAVDLRNYDMVKAILAAEKCDVNVSDTAMLRPLHIASMHGNNRIASLLIRRGAIVDCVQLRGWTPLLLACRAGSEATVKLLLLNGADPNHIGKNEHTALSMSLQYVENRIVAEMLLEAGACVDQHLIKRCKEEKFQALIANPDMFSVLKSCSETPRTLRAFCCLTIRKALLQSRPDVHLVMKVEKLPLPKLIKDFLLLGHLI
ncbi:hypothetical protein FSP39_025429 [Pinctada imbricata]|uniref:SOCS box domain-containing protein n=1 Tax=Pinctada imbricata TaxID=66713 RepID=A0AA89C4J9_PINIB|nr:hypothetical protein FSP39_025429 [Pinctada imbricata]